MLLFNAKCLKKVGLFDDRFFFRGEEWDLCYRIKKAGFKLKLAPKSIIYHKVSRTVKRFSAFDIYCAYRAKLLFGYKCWGKVIIRIMLPLIVIAMLAKFFYYRKVSKSRGKNFMASIDYGRLIFAIILDDLFGKGMRERALKLLHEN